MAKTNSLFFRLSVVKQSSSSGDEEDIIRKFLQLHSMNVLPSFACLNWKHPHSHRASYIPFEHHVNIIELCDLSQKQVSARVTDIDGSSAHMACFKL